MKVSSELLSESWDEIMPLAEAHYLEIAHYQDIPLDPDRERYKALEDGGQLRYFTLRNEVGALVGYCIFVVARHLHYSGSVQAMQDVLFLLPEYRGAYIGKEFISHCDNELRAERIEAVYHHMKAKRSFGPLLESLGYELIDLVYGRRL